MQITVNLTDPRANSIALDEVIFSQAETTLTFNVSPASESLADGLSVALLTPQGGTLAHALVSASAAVLSTSTVECYEFVKGLPIEAARGAYLVIGESLSPKAIIPVQVARNPIAEIAPPTESAPVYPTTQELQEAIDRIEAALTKIEEVEDIVEGFDDTVQQGIAELNATKESAIGEVNAAKDGIAEAQAAAEAAQAGAEAAQTAVEALKTATDANAAATSADALTSAKAAEKAVKADANAKASADAAESAKRTATDAASSAETARNEAVASKDAAETAQGLAETAQTAAETAQHGAEAAQEAAETALNNGCVYEVETITSSAIQLKKTLTAYKHAPTADTAYTFTAPAGVTGKIIVFWLWVIMGETAHQLTFPTGVTWITEGSFAANSQTMLAFMSVDGGASWQANLQWEKAVTA